MKNTEQNPGNGRQNVGKCLNCNLPRKKKKFCSLNCYWKYKTGKKHNWGYKIGNALRGIPKTKKHARNAARARIGLKRPDITGSNAPWWKGNKISYGGLHDWIWSRKGRPEKCEHCGEKGKKSGKKQKHWTIHWANRSKNYKRDLDDWIALCRKCHYQFDKNKK